MPSLLDTYEEGMYDCSLAALADLLAELRRQVFGEQAALTAAVSQPDQPAAAQAAYDRALMEHLRPQVAAAFGETFARMVFTALLADTPQRVAHLLTVHSRLVDAYWRPVYERLGLSTVTEAFEVIRAELVLAREQGVVGNELRDRIGRVMQLDAVSAERRAHARALEQRLFDNGLSAAEVEALWGRRADALDGLFLTDHEMQRARAELANSAGHGRVLEQQAEAARGAQAARLRREAQAARAQVAQAQRTIDRLNQQRAPYLAALREVDARLFTNPTLTPAVQAALARERRDALRAATRAEGLWHYRAERVARTETIGALNGGTVDAARTWADLQPDVRWVKTWDATSDHRTRPSHADADGQTRALHEAFDVGGASLDYPGAPGGPADEVINCRCSVTMDAPGVDVRSVNLTDDSLIAAAAQEDSMTEPALPIPGEQPLPTGWRGALAPLGVTSGDGRIIAVPDTFQTRPLPLPLLAQEALGYGHDGAVMVGSHHLVEIREDGAFGQTGPYLYGEGPLDVAGEAGAEFARQLRDGFAGGVSVDLDGDPLVMESAFVDEAGNVVDVEPEVVLDEDGWPTLVLPDGVREVMVATVWRFMGSTLVTQPAFPTARVEPVMEYVSPLTDSPDAAADRDLLEGLEALAAAAVVGERVYPAAAFARPEADRLTPFTIAEDGSVYGHAAGWDTCHVGYARCVTPPRSQTGYAYFHVGEVLTDEGPLPVGRVTVGGGHADPQGNVRAATQHYDDVATAVAVVRATNGQHGIWLSGHLLDGATPEQVASLRQSPLSGDWRRQGGNLEMIAAHAVVTPGFPIPRTLAASANGVEVSLVASTGLRAPEPRPNAAGVRLDPAAFARAVVLEMRALAQREQRVASLTASVKGSAAERAARAAELVHP